VCGHDKEKADAAQAVETWTKGGGLIIRETEFISIQANESRQGRIGPDEIRQGKMFPRI
jgi:hypothetical protein